MENLATFSEPFVSLIEAIDMLRADVYEHEMKDTPPRTAVGCMYSTNMLHATNENELLYISNREIKQSVTSKFKNRHKR